MTQQSCRWLKVPAPRTGIAARLICFPHAAAGASSFARWLPAAPPHLEIWRVQLPGREDLHQVPPVNDLRIVVPALTDAILSRRDNIPVVLYGHSMGAALAHQVALALRGKNVGLLKALVVSGRRAPGLPPSRRLHHEMDDPELTAVMVAAEPESEIWKRPHWRQHYFHLIRSDSAAAECIPLQREPGLALPLIVYQGSRDDWVSPAELAAWCNATTGPFAVRRYEGGHFDHHAARDAIMLEASQLCGCQEGALA